ncbi:MAG: class I mannose-6-phosphate isomerase [Clostridia bacterium]|nr:class I mannose-6-phosphate isomerase [Clostridia bacterium]
MNFYPFELEPYVSETIWGGRRLIEEYGIVTEKSNAAEGWMLSCHESGLCRISNGALKGRTLREIVTAHPEICGKNACRFDDFPILIKFIDARDDLSVQVHPTDEYCKKTGRGQSKTECWYVLDAAPGAALILGFKEKISSDEFRRLIEEGKLTDAVEKYDVKKGDFFFIESGTLHAICKGVLLAEVQESSNTTYRVFDYNRVGKDGKPRQLHIEDAVAVTKCEPYAPSQYCKDEILYNGAKHILAQCPLFNVAELKIDGGFSGKADDKSFVSLLVLEGEGELITGSGSVNLKKGVSVFIPAATGDYEIAGKLSILETTI